MAYTYKPDDMHGFITFIGAETRERGKEMQFKYCPYCRGGDHHDAWTFSLNQTNGAFKCMRGSCEKHGAFVTLANDFGFALDYGTAEKAWRELPQDREFVQKPAALEYLGKRGISNHISIKYEVTTDRRNPHNLFFPFKDETGKLVYGKLRSMVDRTERSEFGKETSIPGCKPILFGMNHCVAGHPLVITEGQIDSLSVAEAGVPNAVSVPNGKNAFAWIEHCWDWLNTFDTIIVFGDMENGKMSLLDEILKRMPDTITVKAVRAVDYCGMKDANDILRTYGADVVAAAVTHAEVPKMSNVLDLADVPDIDIDNLPRIDTGIRPLDRIIGGMLCGQVVLLSGKRGDGKSTFMSQIIANALEQGKRVFTYSGELPAFHFKRWLNFQLAGDSNLTETVNLYKECAWRLADNLAAQMSAWYKGRAYIYDNEYAGEDLEAITDTIDKAVRRYGIDLVCVDNLMTAMELVDEQTELYRAQSRFVGALKRIAMKHGIVIVLVAHPRKEAAGQFTNDSVSGSADITNKVDVVLNYRRGKQDEGCDNVVEVVKNRMYGKLAQGENGIPLYFSEASRRVFSDVTGQDYIYGWQRAFAETDVDDADLPF